MTALHRRVLLGVAFGVGFGLPLSWVGRMVVRVHVPGWFYTIEVAAALVALACAVRVDGAAAMGVQRRPVSAHLRTVASYVILMATLPVSLWAMWRLMGVAAIYWPETVAAIRSLALTPRTPTTWQHVYMSVHAGICEESPSSPWRTRRWGTCHHGGAAVSRRRARPRPSWSRFDCHTTSTTASSCSRSFPWRG
jgi:hypothetical protein